MLTDLCIYTIKHSDDLRATWGAGGTDTFSVGRKWVRAKCLLEIAKRAGLRLPVIFAPAEATRHLFAWAVLDEVVPDDESVYTFSELRLFNPRPLKTALRKASNGQPLARRYVRSYAICHTPDFLRGQAKASVANPSPASSKNRRRTEPGKPKASSERA